MPHQRRQREQPLLAANLAVVALRRLLAHLEPFVELRFVFERRAVNALQLRVLFVAAIIRRCQPQQLERLHVASARNVRAGAEIAEFAIAKKRNRFPFRNVINPLQLERLFLFLVMRLGLLARQLGHFEGLILLHHLLHLCFDLLEIIRREPMLQIEVIIKPLIRRRPNIQLRLRPNPQNRRGQHMRARMPNARQPIHFPPLLQRLPLHLSFSTFHWPRCVAQKQCWEKKIGFTDCLLG